MLKKIGKIGKNIIFRLKWEDRKYLYQYPQKYIFPKSTYSPWLADRAFLETYALCAPNTLVDIYRCFELWDIAASKKEIEGAIIEIGVWRGGTGAILTKASNDQAPVYLCDTFKGVVKASDKDNAYRGGEHNDTSPELVNALFKSLDLNNYRLLEGIFPEETAHLIPESITFKICHIDVDVYESAKSIFSWVWPRLIKGGIIIFDDYGFASCEGITLLVNELAKKKDIFKFHNLNGHGILLKLS